MKKVAALAFGIVCFCFLALFTCGMSVDDTVDRTIPYPKGLDTGASGASSYQNSGDHPYSPYFLHPDFYNMKSNENLTIISNYKTYQQTTEYTCGPSAALTVLVHFNCSGWNETGLAAEMNSSEDVGTSVRQMVDFFKGIGWEVCSSEDEGILKDGATFNDSSEFTLWVINSLTNNVPIMVDWLDWGGHWQALIGYDTSGTASFGDDILILADPYDTSDHLQDGYYVFPAERFYYMWQDNYPEDPGKSLQPWLIAKPKE